MTLHARFIVASCLLVLAACSTASPASPGTVAIEYVIVRHAEKGTDDRRDPSLSEAGAARAQVLARLLADAPLRAVYATGYRRTQQTGETAALAHGLAVSTYDAELPATVFAKQLQAAHKDGVVLVVGHSNTVPQMVSALSGQPVEPMPDTVFNRLYRVRVDASGNATLVQEVY